MITIGSLFTGCGGLDLGVERLFKGKVIWTCDNAKGPRAVIGSRFIGVPNLGDIATVDWRIIGGTVA